jgi:hypothetical protein
MTKRVFVFETQNLFWYSGAPSRGEILLPLFAMCSQQN